MRHNRLKSDLLTTTSTRGNNGDGQACTIGSRFTPHLSMQDWHDTFHLLAHREGVPDILASDQAEEEMMGQMRRKV
jgi:hypothetical protein